MKYLYVSVMFMALCTMGACKKSENLSEGMGDSSAMQVMQIPATQPLPPALPNTLPASLPASQPSSQPASQTTSMPTTIPSW